MFAELGVFDDFEVSFVQKIAPNRMKLHLSRFELRNQIAIRQPIVGGWNLEFFVGISYFSLLPTNAIATVATQSKIHIVETDSLTFATSSSQDFSFIEYITITLFETKYIFDSFLEHRLQYVRVGIILPKDITQNMETGLVPLTGIRFAVDQNLPDFENMNTVQNPCFSIGRTGSAIMDNSNSHIVQAYEQASHQRCSLQPDFCQNPPSEIIENGFFELYFPIGDHKINKTMLEDNNQYSLFVSMDVSVVLSSGKKAIQRLFSQSSLTSVSITTFCESFDTVQTINDILTVNLDIGIAGNLRDMNTSVMHFPDILADNSEIQNLKFIDTTQSVEKAASAASSLLSISVIGEKTAFQTEIASDFHIEIDDLISLHFLDAIKYNQVIDLLSNNQAFDVLKMPSNKYLEVALTNDVLEICNNINIPNDFSCVIRQNIHQRNIIHDYALHSMARKNNLYNESITVQWLQKNLLGFSEFSFQLAQNFSRMQRDKYDTNDRFNKIWLMNPMYAWTVDDSAAQSILSLSENTLILGIFTLEDENTNTRRFLLQQTTESNSLYEISDADLQIIESNIQAVKEKIPPPVFPPIENAKVVNDLEILR